MRCPISSDRERHFDKREYVTMTRDYTISALSIFMDLNNSSLEGWKRTPETKKCSSAFPPLSEKREEHERGTWNEEPREKGGH